MHERVAISDRKPRERGGKLEDGFLDCRELQQFLGDNLTLVHIGLDCWPGLSGTNIPTRDSKGGTWHGSTKPQAVWINYDAARAEIPRLSPLLERILTAP